MVLVSGGGYAEYVAAHMGCAMKIPEGISMVEAAGEYFMLFVLKWELSFIGIPETYLTAFQGLRLIGNIKKNDAVLIHAGAR
jgi:NADPH:quinone reductase-like Zn-dependent oxidoreductase